MHLLGLALLGTAFAAPWASATGADPAVPRPAEVSAEAPEPPAIARCFRLRDSDPAAAVSEAGSALDAGGLSPGEEIKLRTCLGRSLALTGDAAGAEAEVARVDRLLEQHPMPPEFQLRALSNLGATLHTLGRQHRALHYYLRAYETATRTDSEEAQEATLVNVASIQSETLGAYEQAEALYAQAQGWRLRADATSPILPHNRGLNLLRMGRTAEALAQFEEAERLAVASGHRLVGTRARAERLALQALQGSVPMDVARASLMDIVREQQGMEDLAGAAITLVRLSRLALHEGAPDAALAHADQAASLLDGPAFQTEQRDVLAARVAAHAASNDWRSAHESLQALHETETALLRGLSLDNLADLQARLQDTEREREVLRLQDAQRLEALTLRSERRLRNLSIAGLVVVLLLGIAFAWYQRRVNRRLARLSRVDPLTGLLNRRAAAGRLQVLGAMPAQDDRRDVVFLIDIDHFKARNDRDGHAAGDAALADVARQLRACCRPEDIVARWGGEEFLVGCRQLDLPRARQVAERLRAAVGGPATPPGTAAGPARLSVSVGFACFPFFPGATAPGDWQEAVALADRALYAAKHSGRDAWVGLWGVAGRGVDFGAVAADPGAHAERGDIIVVSSREPVRWQEG